MCLQNTLIFGKYHSSLSGKCAKQQSGVCDVYFYYCFSLTEKKRKRQKHHYPSILKHSIVALPSRNSAAPRACENRDYKNSAPLGKEDLGLEHRPAACCLPFLEIKVCMHA